eukprot:TRINITY_DN13921_c0_g1_i1.p1 TRINITY_DN13921_c0_g1~~TRINITY_DN13921_c0_g1_i1.p1  ORF type:complete len:214 (+),score=-4.35 TRINITY_DN13921_c0_g1_i1:101-742(+)
MVSFFNMHSCRCSLMVFNSSMHSQNYLLHYFCCNHSISKKHNLFFIFGFFFFCPSFSTSVRTSISSGLIFRENSLITSLFHKLDSFLKTQIVFFSNTHSTILKHTTFFTQSFLNLLHLNPISNMNVSSIYPIDERKQCMVPNTSISRPQTALIELKQKGALPAIDLFQLIFVNQDLKWVYFFHISDCVHSYVEMRNSSILYCLAILFSLFSLC